jgi:adenosylmethionine---8-amino-7-oxononanoate aminotransferase
MASANTDLIVRDLAHVWHPCTQMKDHEQLPPIPVRRRRGAGLEGSDGKPALYPVSDCLVNILRHPHPRKNPPGRAPND